MSFTRANPLGWGLFEELTSAQMNALDIDHANAYDILDGGPYAPATAAEFSQNGPKWAGTDYWPEVELRTIIRPAKLAILRSTQNATPGTPDWSIGTGLTLRQDAIPAAAARVWIELDVADRNAFDHVEIRLDPAGANPAPTTLPVATLFMIDHTGVTTVLSSEVDPGGGAYRNAHTLRVPQSGSLNHTPHLSNSLARYILNIDGEANANAAAGLVVTYVGLFFVVDKLAAI